MLAVSGEPSEQGSIPGGIYALGEPVGRYMSFYVAVDDLEGALAQAETLGAKLASRRRGWPTVAG